MCLLFIIVCSTAATTPRAITVNDAHTVTLAMPHAVHHPTVCMAKQAHTHCALIVIVVASAPAITINAIANQTLSDIAAISAATAHSISMLTMQRAAPNASVRVRPVNVHRPVCIANKFHWP